MFKILVEQGTDNFTALELRDACEQLSPTATQDKPEAYKTIYRQLIKLKRNNMLTTTRRQGLVYYIKTENFIADRFTLQISPNSFIEQPSTLAPAVKLAMYSELLDKLKECEVDMLSAMGESDEYKSLYSSYPAFKEQLEEKYLMAREKSSKILGQITAIKNVIKEIQPL